jgi:hypothetical protein
MRRLERLVQEATCKDPTLTQATRDFVRCGSTQPGRSTDIIPVHNNMPSNITEMGRVVLPDEYRMEQLQGRPEAQGFHDEWRTRIAWAKNIQEGLPFVDELSPQEIQEIHQLLEQAKQDAEDSQYKKIRVASGQGSPYNAAEMSYIASMTALWRHPHWPKIEIQARAEQVFDKQGVTGDESRAAWYESALHSQKRSQSIEDEWSVYKETEETMTEGS